VQNAHPEELQYLMTAVSGSLFKRICRNPSFILAIDIGMLDSDLLKRVDETTHAALVPVLKSNPPANSNTGEMEAKNLNMEEESTSALRLHHITVALMEDIQIALLELTHLKAWCQEFDNSGTIPEQNDMLKTAGGIILERFIEIENRFKSAEIAVRSTQTYTQAYKQSVQQIVSMLNAFADCPKS
jgi:hypothetical protein